MKPLEILIKEENGKRYIRCLVRKRWLVLGPEEWVRQHLILHLTNNLKYPILRIGVEVKLNYNQINKRADIVIYNKEGKATWIIECKEQGVNLTNEVMHQVLIYNSILDVKYVSITNGLNTISWERINNEFKLIENWPEI
jgi:type I site-specific restriction endonuclease